jgi:multicomponent Na+:H+ antiporter subunit C
VEILGYFNYWVFAVVLMIGLYAVIARGNLIKKLLGLSIFQSAVFLMYITMDKVEGGTAPIIQPGAPDQLYSNPLPQVLILTAIVVGVSTIALGLAIVVRIKESYGTIEEDEILDEDIRLAGKANSQGGETST